MNIVFVTENQKRINELIDRYEKETRKMLECPIDDILMLTEKRASIAEEITKLDNAVKAECADNPAALAAYTNKSDRSDLTGELTEIFDLRQEFNSIAFRVQSLDLQIKERITMIRDELIVKIKKNNAGQNAKAAKYAVAGLSDGGNAFIPENKKRI